MRTAAPGAPWTDPEPRERAMAARPLTETLDVRRDARIAAIGGGGKKTVLFALAREWAKAGGRPLVLPTTRLYRGAAGEATGAGAAAASGAPDDLFDARVIALDKARSAWSPIDFPAGGVLVLGRRDENPDLLSAILPEEIAPLAEQVKADLVLVKADGSRGRSLKAHREHEPVIPMDASLVIAVAGLDVWGAPLTPETVHRSELFAVKWGMTPGERLEDEAFLYALGDPSGYRAAVPQGARYVVFLNQVDRPVRLAVAQRLAEKLHAAGVSDVVYGDVLAGDWTLSRAGAR
jgi:probable selenium-dependent hydroxylase accessory protein YqeC